MKIVGEKMRELREGVKLSQMKLCAMAGCNQSSLARYENGIAVPPLRLLVWYADHFDVSLDYIFGRTDFPQGKLYEFAPKITAPSDEMRRFVEMCFDPKSPLNGRLKDTILDMFSEEECE